MVDVENISLETWESMSESAQQACFMRAAIAADVDTDSEFELDLLRFVHVSNLSGYPVKLRNLNIRFVRRSNKLGLKVKYVVLNLVERGLIKSITTKKNQCILVSTQFEANQRAYLMQNVQADTSTEQVERITEIIDKFSNSAQ